MNSHVPETGSHSNCFVRHEPELAGSDSIHLHRKPHRRINRANANIAERCHNAMGDFVYSMSDLMKFDIRHRTRGIANWLAIHSQDETDQRPGPGKEPDDVVSFCPEVRTIDIDKPDIISAGGQS
jgi:hypothetical protein